MCGYGCINFLPHCFCSAPAAPGASEGTEPGSVFERIDASKLQGALANASVLTNLEVSHSLISLQHNTDLQDLVDPIL